MVFLLKLCLLINLGLVFTDNICDSAFCEMYDIFENFEDIICYTA